MRWSVYNSIRYDIWRQSCFQNTRCYQLPSCWIYESFAQEEGGWSRWEVQHLFQSQSAPPSSSFSLGSGLWIIETCTFSSKTSDDSFKPSEQVWRRQFVKAQTADSFRNKYIHAIHRATEDAKVYTLLVRKMPNWIVLWKLLMSTALPTVSF